MMDDTTDFTFCKVSLQVGDHLKSPETIPNIDSITLEGNHLNDDGIHTVVDSNRDDSPRVNGKLKIIGSKGSPSNTIKDILLPNSKVSESQMKNRVGETEGSLIQTHQQHSVTKKSAVRAKVPFEKGFSQMHWLKLTRSEPCLAGLNGQSNRRLISIDEVRQHNSEGSIWTVLKGRVYNISPYMKFHPGGVDMLMKAAGKDCTALFNKYHAWVNAEFLLEKCLVGVLDA